MFSTSKTFLQLLRVNPLYSKLGFASHRMIWSPLVLVLDGLIPSASSALMDSFMLVVPGHYLQVDAGAI